MSENPLVTVNILSFNRKEELRNTLTKVYEQDYKNIEAIVVDNASSDGSAEMVLKEFPLVKLIQLEKNIGVAGWNEGFKVATGEYVLVLDDDSYPAEGVILDGIKIIEKDDSTGIVAFKIFNSYLQEYESNFIADEPLSFIGCGALLKKRLLNQLGGYNDLYFLYHNELDLAARSINSGYKIKMSDKVVIHNFNVNNRNLNNQSIIKSRQRYYHFFISQSIFFIQRLYVLNGIKMMFKWIINRSIVAIRFGYFKEFFRALFIIILNGKKYFRNREPLQIGLQRKYFGLIAYMDRNYFPNFKKPRLLNFIK